MARVYFVGSRSFTNWRAYGLTRFSSSLGTTPSTTNPVNFNEDAVCPHNHLKLDSIRCLPPSLWNQVVNLIATSPVPTYPSDEFDLTPCSQCADIKDTLLNRVHTERDALSSVLTGLALESPWKHLDGLISEVR